MSEKKTKVIDGTEYEVVELDSTDARPTEAELCHAVTQLDPPDPALARWQELASREHEVCHDGDAEKILGDVHRRPSWADPDEDRTGRSHLSSGYASRPVRVRASHAFGVDHGDEWQPACAFVSAKFWGNSHESIHVTLSQVEDGQWQNVGMSFQPHEALELAEVLKAAVDLLGGDGD